MRAVTLGDIADWGSGGTPKRSVAKYFGNGVPWLSISDLNDAVVTRAKESLTKEGVANSSAKVVPAGTILIAIYGSIGKLGIAGREMCTSQAIAFAKPHAGVVEPKFLFHYLLAQRPALRALGRGGTQMNIGQGDLKSWPIELPTLRQQRRIVAILEQVQAVRDKRGQVLAHLGALTQSIFHDMFGDCSEVVYFGDVIGKGPTNGLYRPSSDYGSGTPILRIDGFDAGEVKPAPWKRVQISAAEIERYSLATGDVIINRVNALSHLGKSAIVERLDEPSVYESNMMRIRLETGRVEPRFVIAWLQGASVKRQILAKAKKAINQASINQADVRSLVMPLPPLGAQEIFSKRVEAIKTQRDLVKHGRAADDEIFASVQARAFRGEFTDG